MSKKNTTGTTKIAISLPKGLLDTVERERQETGESRSELFRRSVELLLRQRREQELCRQYVDGYTRQPEGAEEVEAARGAAAAVLAQEPWD